MLGYLVVATISLKSAHVSGTTAVVSALAYHGVAVVLVLLRGPRYNRHLQQMRTGGTRPPLLEVVALSVITAALALHWLWLSD